MFEKEAKEYMHKDGTESEKLLNTIDLSLTKRQAFVLINICKQCFKDGAEFGYNKANEEMQKQDYSLFDFVMQYENGKFKCEYKSGKVFESVDGETWKEIVLPNIKEIKEND